MSLKIKLISMMSAFVLVLSMLLVGVLAATGGFTINLKGNVEFNIDDSTLYIKDIRLSDGLTVGETIDNFLSGFAGESFELDFGTISSDSGTISIEIDVINTTETTYNASSQSNLSNATLTVSGTIAGDSVPLDQVATYDGISGTIYISAQVTSSTTINLDNIVIDIAEQTGYTVNISVVNSSAVVPLYVKIDGGEEIMLDLGGSITLNGSVLSMSITSFTSFNSISYNGLNEVELYAPEVSGRCAIYLNDNYAYVAADAIIMPNEGVWKSLNPNENFYLTDDGRVLNYILASDCEIVFSY